jgi:hypothetical protein
MNNNNIKLLIIILIIISTIEIVPILLTIFKQTLCYGCTIIGKLHQELNSKYNLSTISWFAYMILFILFIYLSNKISNIYLKYFLIFLCIFIIYVPVFPILNIINLILSLNYKNTPFIKNYHDIFPASINIEKNSESIINEYKNYIKTNNAECIKNSNPGFKIELSNNDKNCWRALYLKKIGIINKNMIKFFPNTIKLLNDKQIHTAFFSILDPGVEISPHVGYYKGYLRYHIGIIIPNNNKETNDKAYIICGNEKYIWKEKEGIVFDDTYLHYVKNPSNQTRVVLYIDIIREKKNNIIDLINDLGIFFVENSIVLNYFLKNQHLQTKII